MEPNTDAKPWYYWQFSKRTTVVVMVALGLFLLVFQVNKLLSSSFRIEVFGVEILEVRHLGDVAAAEETGAQEAPVVRHRRVIRPRAPLPPAPPLLPMPPDTPEEREAPEAPGRYFFVVVEEMPELIGGLGSIQRELNYPEIAKRAGIEGRVIVQFIVDEQGRVETPKVVRGIGGGCDEEAVRVVSQARFKPGRQRGKNVEVKMSLPVTFKLPQ